MNPLQHAACTVHTFRAKTGAFGYALGRSSSVVESVEEKVLTEGEGEEVLRQYKPGVFYRLGIDQAVKYALYKIRENSIVRYIVNWSRLSSLWPVHLTTACCSVEFAPTTSPRYDPERFGFLPATGSLRSSDLIIVEGTVTSKMAQRVRMIYDQMPDPKWVLAMGACAISGGLYARDSYNVIQGVDDIVPVDVYIPGCPPRPESVFQAVLLLRDKILHQKLVPNGTQQT